jgi:oligopeptidase B
MKAPIAKKTKHRFNEHNIERTDNYYWLKDKENQTVLDYIDAENDYADFILNDTEDFQEDLYQEMKSRIKEDDSSVPYFKNDYWYYTRYEEGGEFPLYCRKEKSLDSIEEVLLNENELAEDYDYYEIVSFSVSPDNKTLVFCEDIIGNGLYQMRFINLETGKHYRDLIENTSSDLAWMNDSESIFYTVKEDKTLRPHQIRKHVLNTPSDNDNIIFTEKDEKFITGVSRDKIGKFVFIGSWSSLSTEYRILNVTKLDAEFEIFYPRAENLEYYPESTEFGFFVKHNADGENFSISFCEYNDRDKSKWSTILKHDPDILIEDYEVFENYLDSQEKEYGLTRLRDYNSSQKIITVFPQ